jgi:drug/metabolite transporter (DMT)-like permease
LNTHNSITLQNKWHGILLVVSGLSIAAFTGALMKLLAEDLSPYQITWFRFLVFALIMLPIVTFKIGLSAMKPARVWMQVCRGLTMSTATVCFVIGAQTVDFADAIAILYAYPFLLTVIAITVLGERVTWTGWLGVCGGFAGVLLVMRPEFENINRGTLYVFLCATIVSIQMAMNRKLGSISPPLVTALWGAVVAALTLSIVVPFHWQPVNPEQFGLMLLMALAGTVNQVCLVYGFAKAEASTLAPFTYLEIVAAVIFGYLIFGTLPVWVSWLGILMIVLSGIIVATSNAK